MVQYLMFGFWKYGLMVSNIWFIVRGRFKFRVMVLSSFQIFIFRIIDLIFNIKCLVFNVWVMGFFPWGFGFMVGVGLELMLVLGLGFRLFFRFQDLGYRFVLQFSWFNVECQGFGISCFGFRVQSLWLGLWIGLGLWFMLGLGLRFMFQVLGIGVQGFSFKIYGLILNIWILVLWSCGFRLMASAQGQGQAQCLCFRVCGFGLMFKVYALLFNFGVFVFLTQVFFFWTFFWTWGLGFV